MARFSVRTMFAEIPWVTVAGAIFAVVGGAMLSLARKQFVRRRAFMRGSVVAQGTVVALTANRDHERISYFPKVKFQTPSGREITFESEAASEDEKVGATVRVRYRPDQPEHAEVDSFLSLWGLTLLFAVLGVAFTSIGLGILSGFLRV